MPEQAYLDAIAANCKEDPLGSLPPATVADIELPADGTPEAISAVYEKWGCCVMRGLLSDRAADVLADAEAMAAGVRDAGYESRNNAYVPAGGATGHEKQIMLFCPTYTLAASHFLAATDPRLLDAVEAMIGPNVEMYGNGMCMYKEPGGGMEKALHQDAPYFYHRDHSFMTAFLHLVETTDENGVLHAIPGSFKLGLLEHIDTPSHLALPPGQFPLDCAMPIYAQPGDVVFFNYLTVHGSGLNLSEKARPALCMQYRKAGDSLAWHCATTVDNLGLPANEEERTRSFAVVRGRKIT